LGALSRSLAAAGLGLALTACTAWPPAGQGGAAEQGGPAVPVAGLDPDLVARLRCVVAGAETVRGTALARHQMTGRAADLAEASARAQREVHGGLAVDAAASIGVLEARTADLALALGVPVPVGLPECG
jgi:hypothetical protein